MRLKLLILSLPLIVPLAGCVVHFPLGENIPSLASQEETPTSDAGTMAQPPNEPGTRGGASGNSPNTPDLPQ